MISLFNGFIPLIAIQMQAIQVGDAITLVFTRILDELTFGLVDEDEDAQAAPADRTSWEAKATKQTVALVDRLLEFARDLDPALELKYNKFYVGLSKAGQPFNFVVFRPRKNFINLEVRLPKIEETDAKIEAAGLETLDHAGNSGAYRLRLTEEDIAQHSVLLKELMRAAHERYAR